ncbi:beta-ketoacyl-[acyl-carrier-protein] synthase family protein [Vitiosangium sp. GDMCC 1.1324]|uniref:beta-ketoacyl-[acyl-carrier-protein] synthase family protein n=1 Tax=Vitiosangium sp. (strain GDMCC 1.1324) TaxID=2138576 RepID=UPI000D3703B8|nr:beta-ketoacyl-[acyl-carrier-protein] synthase family protein [Vitiosangium sp. GDMCC 1.1324]PTL75010.1 beta-ketoacyl-[acyl-carrier-protein] synthase family protein [Vitiosangium sp. GDMCC 1.1324]
MRGVAITGMGIVSGLGSGAAAHLEALRSGRSGLGPLTLFSLPGLAPAPVGQVDEALLQGIHGSRSVALALLAARQAMGGAGFAEPGVLAIGTTTGGIQESEQHYLKHRGQAGAEERELLRYHSAGTIADVLSADLRLSAERHTFSTACSSSANAIGHGASRIMRGAPWALVGGVDSLCRLTYCGFHSLKLLASAQCRPFDRNRQGLNLGEGAAFLLLENEEHARRRGASILGYVAGWGCSADAYHITAPHPEGLGAVAAMKAALADAGLSPSDVDYVNAHGTATPANDKAEALALEALFPGEGPLVSSTKGATGHTLGAAGAMEAVFCVLAMQASHAPATVGLSEPESQFRVRHVPPGGVDTPLRVALSNSFGFGGNNAALVLTRSES